MKKAMLLFLANSGVLAITNHDLDPAHAYKVVKFRKALSNALDTMAKDEDELRKDAGIPDAAAFDNELHELRNTKDRTEVQTVRLDEMEAALKRFIDLRAQMMDEEVTLDCKALPYTEWHKLQNENKEKDVNGRKTDVLSGYVEDLLEGVLWIAPEE
jgi:ABC-type nitrate/sulfonate/bicarbonate transport system substrate-binding protein